MSTSGESVRRQQARTYGPDFLTALLDDPLDPSYADAAARRRIAGRPSRWVRRRDRGITVLVLLAVGFLLAVAYLQTVAEEPDRAKGRAALAQQILQHEEMTDDLAGRVDRLREEVARQRDAALSGPDAARLRELEAVTGLARVRGDGIVVRVSDAPADEDAVTGAEGPNQGRVLDRDLQLLANALWAAGAEAIAVNGQRLTSTSTIMTAGSAILVDFQPVVGPYEVAAIGPDEMEERFQDSVAARLMRSIAIQYGMGFQVRQADDLTLPAADEPRLDYARRPPTPTPSPPGAGASTSPSGGG